MGRVLVGALVAGVVMFVWSFSAWMFLGIHDLDVEPQLENEEAVVKALEGNVRGVYWIPGASMDHDPDSPEHKAWEEKHKQGPRGWLVYDPAGAEPMSMTTMIIGLVINILVGLVLALMLRGANVAGFFGRFLVVFGVGVVVALVMDVSTWNWQNHPTDWTRGFVIDHVVGFALIGFLLAIIVKPATRAA